MRIGWGADSPVFRQMFTGLFMPGATPDLANFFSSGCAIMYPYAGPPPCTKTNNPMTAVISELYVDSALQAHVIWSVGFQGGVALTVGPVAGLPPNLLVSQTYLIFSQVTYTYTPTVGYVMKAAINLSDVSYTRPRQSACVFYPPPPVGTNPACPTS